MGGKAVDGYIEGAKIFIDENFNLKLDDGEIWGVTDASGSFLMDVPVQRLLSMNLIELKSSGTTPIYEAVHRGHTEIVKVLAPLTDNPNAPNKWGTTPIRWAVQNGHQEIVKILAPFDRQIIHKCDFCVYEGQNFSYHYF